MRSIRLHLCCVILVTLGAWARGEGVASPAQSPVAVSPNVPPDGVITEPARIAPPSSALGEQPIRMAPSQDAGYTSTSPNPAAQGMDFPRVLAALGIVIGLIFVLRWLGKFLFPAATGRGGNRVIEVMSRSAISPKQQVMLIRVGKRLIVVGDTGSQMNPLCEISDPDEIAALVGQLRDEKTSSTTRAFGAIFRRSRTDFERPEDEAAVPDRPATLVETEEDPPVASAREELNGLRDRVRMLAEQFTESA
jgi:flagellar biogenesis protein FliO